MTVAAQLGQLVDEEYTVSLVKMMMHMMSSSMLCVQAHVVLLYLVRCPVDVPLCWRLMPLHCEELGLGLARDLAPAARLHVSGSRLSLCSNYGGLEANFASMRMKNCQLVLTGSCFAEVGDKMSHAFYVSHAGMEPRGGGGGGGSER